MTATKTRRPTRKRGLPAVATVHVDRIDIQRGLPNDRGHCPGAHAIARAFDEIGVEVRSPKVDKRKIRATINGDRYEWATPTNLARQIVKLDTAAEEGKPKRFTPLVFDLDFKQAKKLPRRALSPTRIGKPTAHDSNPAARGTLNRRKAGV